MYDVIILGSGIAGLLTADLLARKGMSVALVCKSVLAESNTSKAQGGLAAVTGANPVDSTALHLKDTLSSGAGLTDAVVAGQIIARGGELIQMLADRGVHFDSSNGVTDVALEGGHCRARVLHSKDASGRAISTSLIDKVRAHENVHIMENVFALDLIVQEDRCVGVTVLKGEAIEQITAAHTVLATGGLGQVFSRTTNPAVATGDGIAMAYRAGAKLVDMEFVQFHPTALSLPNMPADLISEAVRGAGAVLLDREGTRFAFRYHKDGELATRDVVARAIYTTMQEQATDAVMLDMRPIGADSIREKFPNIVSKCMERGLDPTQTAIPISPAAHYFMGGVLTDIAGSTSIPGLYAIGECASNGLHGANRLASNSLLEGGVMAMYLADRISGSTPAVKLPKAKQPGDGDRLPIIARADFQALMFRFVGLERSTEKLERVVGLFSQAPSSRAAANQYFAEKQNMQLLGWLIAESALKRQESRGAHWRTDFVATNDRDFLKRRYVSRYESGWIEMAQPVNFVYANVATRN
jgi:L-aspartate oxidase